MMITKFIQDVCKLARLDTCLLVLITVFAPSYYHDGDIYFSLTHALPLAVMCMCTFILNDINDIEKDKINHPKRVLASNAVSIKTAVILYFLALSASLLLVKIYIHTDHVFFYLLFLIALINYDYIVSAFPYLKNLYVATTSMIPLVILARISLNEIGYFSVSLAIFVFIMGREIFMDILDAEGDELTLAKGVGLRRSAFLAATLQGFGVGVLAFISESKFDYMVIIALALSYFLILIMWFSGRTRQKLILLMKLQMLVGVYFLF